MGAAWTISVPKVDELIKLLAHDRMMAGPIRTVLEGAGRIGEGFARSGAPSETGLLRARLTHKLSGGRLPTWVVVKTDAQRSASASGRAYSYPRLLEFSPKHGHQGWFWQSISRAWTGGIAGLFDKAHQQLSQYWGGR